MKAIRALALAFVAATVCSAAPAFAGLCDPPMPIRFAHGSSAGTVHGVIARGEIACWSFAAKAGQIAHVRITSTEKNAVFSIYKPGWKISHDEGDTLVDGRDYPATGEYSDAMSWSGPLAETGQHLIVVGATRGGAEFRLRLEIAK